MEALHRTFKLLTFLNIHTHQNTNCNYNMALLPTSYWRTLTGLISFTVTDSFVLLEHREHEV